MYNILNINYTYAYVCIIISMDKMSNEIERISTLVLIGDTDGWLCSCRNPMGR